MSVKSLKTGTRSISMLAGNTPEHHVLIAETTVGTGGTASVTFSSIPADYQHLQIRIMGLTTGSTSSAEDFTIRLNSDTSANYSTHGLYGNGTAASSSADTTSTSIRPSLVNRAITNGISVAVIDVLDYASTTKYKTLRALGGYDNNGSGQVGLGSGLWRKSPIEAVTTIYISNGTNNWNQHSTFALYGVK